MAKETTNLNRPVAERRGSQAGANQAGEPGQPGESPLSLRRLRNAFAAMLKPQQDGDPPLAAGGGRETVADTRTSLAERRPADPCEINPRSVVEALLFVGRPDDGGLSARELASAMRGVSPDEIAAVVAELNTAYDLDGAPYAIIGSPNGYRLALREEYRRVRDKFYGRVRDAKLSPAALEVLSIVAYRQPILAEEVNQLRGRPSGGVLATLVRRQLVQQERSEQRGEPPRYRTTTRFLRLFGLENLAALPRSEELEKV